MIYASLCPGRRVLDGDRDWALENERFSLRWQPSAHQRLFLCFHVVLRGMTLIPKEFTSAPDSAVHSHRASLPSWACSGLASEGCLAGEWDVAKGQSHRSWTRSHEHGSLESSCRWLEEGLDGPHQSHTLHHTLGTSPKVREMQGHILTHAVTVPAWHGGTQRPLSSPGAPPNTHARLLVGPGEQEQPKVPHLALPHPGVRAGRLQMAETAQKGCKQPNPGVTAPLLLSTRDLRKQAGMLINI